MAASSGEEGGDFANALRLLRQEREAAEINLALAERELIRLRQEAVTARRAAEEARAQLSAETERSRSAVRDEAGQEELLQKVEQFNLLRESNAA
jgi:nucleoprotein TPR